MVPSRLFLLHSAVAIMYISAVNGSQGRRKADSGIWLQTWDSLNTVIDPKAAAPHEDMTQRVRRHLRRDELYGNEITRYPTKEPTPPPTRFPTNFPTRSPTNKPTERPTASPSASPSNSPISSPTISPSAFPTDTPTASPVISPSEVPSLAPSLEPTDSPIASPSAPPTLSPTISSIPTANLSGSPSVAPSTSLAPTSAPTETIPMSAFRLIAHTNITDSTATVDRDELESIMEEYLLGRLEVIFPEFQISKAKLDMVELPKGETEREQYMFSGDLSCRKETCSFSKDSDAIILESLLGNIDQLLASLQGADDPWLQSIVEIDISLLDSVEGNKRVSEVSQYEKLANEEPSSGTSPSVLIPLITVVAIVAFAGVNVGIMVYRKRRNDHVEFPLRVVFGTDTNDAFYCHLSIPNQLYHQSKVYRQSKVTVAVGQNQGRK